MEVIEILVILIPITAFIIYTDTNNCIYYLN